MFHRRWLSLPLAGTWVFSESEKNPKSLKTPGTKQRVFFAGAAGGIPGATKAWHTLTPVDLGGRFRKVTFGQDFAVGLTAEGELRKWIGNEEKKFPTAPKDVVDVDCSTRRMFVLTRSGEG